MFLIHTAEAIEKFERSKNKINFEKIVQVQLKSFYCINNRIK